MIRYKNEGHYEEHLRSVFGDAVQCRLDTQAPVLSELSGGLDSSSIACMAHQLLKDRRPLEVVERGYVDPVSLTKRLERITHSVDCNEPQLRQIILLEFWLRGRGRQSTPANARLRA